MRTLACCLLLSLHAISPAAAPPAHDRLRPAARLRLGVSRWRHQFDALHDAPPVLSSDRKLVACRTHDDFAVEVFDVDTHRRIFHFREDRGFACPLAFSSDGNSLAVVNVDSDKERVTLTCWPVGGVGRPHTFPIAPSLDRLRWLTGAAFLPGDSQLATYDGMRLQVWDVATGERLRDDRIRARTEFEAAFSPDSRTFAGQEGASVVLADLVTGRWRRVALRLPEKPSDPVRLCRWSWSADGKRLAVSTDGLVRIHETATGRILWELRCRSKTPPATAFSPDGRTLAVQDEFVVQMRDTRTGEVVSQFSASARRRSWLGFRDDNRLFVLDPFEQRWDLRTGREVTPDGGHRTIVTCLAFADARTLLSIGADDRLLRWDVRTGRQRDEMPLPGGFGGAFRLWLSLSASGRVALATAERNDPQGNEVGEAVFIDLQRGQAGWHEKGRLLDATATRDTFGVTSADGSLVALPVGRWRDAGSDLRWHDRYLEVRRADGGVQWTFDLSHRGRQAFSPDSRELAVSFWNDGTGVRLIDLHTGETTRTSKAGEGRIESIAYSPDGRLLAAADWDCLWLWERATGQCIDRIAFPSKFTGDEIRVTRDGRVLVLGMVDRHHVQGRHAVWDSRLREPLTVTAPHGGPAALCPEGRTLAVGCPDSSILLYDVPRPDAGTRPLGEGEARRLWDDLASEDARHAWRARRRLAGAPADAVALLRARLKPAPRKAPVDVTGLDADDFDARMAVTKRLAVALARRDRAAEDALRGLLASRPSPEACLRARRLLAEPVPYSRQELRLIRAVGVLEQIADGEAKALLLRLAKGGPSLLTSEASATLTRIELIDGKSDKTGPERGR